MTTFEWKLKLNFVNEESPQLISTYFSSPLLSQPVRGVRALYAGREEVAFKWSKATVAVAVLMLKIKLHRALGSPSEPILQGESQSTAKVLANQVFLPATATALFGFTEKGDPILRRVINIANGKRNKGGDTRIYLRDLPFPDHLKIEVTVDNESILDLHRITNMVLRLEAHKFNGAGLMREEVQVSLAA